LILLQDSPTDKKRHHLAKASDMSLKILAGFIEMDIHPRVPLSIYNHIDIQHKHTRFSRAYYHDFFPAI
jgi:hypothetical protein